jgi:hypothetical protein
VLSQRVDEILIKKCKWYRYSIWWFKNLSLNLSLAPRYGLSSVWWYIYNQPEVEGYKVRLKLGNTSDDVYCASSSGIVVVQMPDWCCWPFPEHMGEYSDHTWDEFHSRSLVCFPVGLHGGCRCRTKLESWKERELRECVCLESRLSSATKLLDYKSTSIFLFHQASEIS